MLRILLPVVVAAVVLACAGTASATTFCVPAFHAACPANGTNVAKGTVEAAAKSNAVDGAADTVIIAAGTFTDDDDGTIAPTGTDVLTIQGAGAGATILTSSANTNIYVFNENSRPTVVRDVRIVVPASFPDGQGAAAQTSKNSLLERVDFEVRNPGSDALSSFATGTYRDGRIYATGAGSIGRGIAPNGAQGAGPIILERLRIENTTSAVAISNVPSVPVTLRRSAIVNPSQVGVSAFGGSATVENSVIEVAGTATALSAAAYPGGATGALTARHVTVVGSAGASGAALSSRVNGGVSGDASLTLRDSIVRGFGTPFARSAPGSLVDGDASLTIATSNVAPTGTDLGDGTLTLTNNINADPLFTGPSDFRLLTGSPSIDAADAASPLTEDRDGNARPTDGNGDGTLRADQGAYEAPTVVVVPPVDPPPVTTPIDPPPGTTPIDPPPTPAKDTRAPRLSSLKVVGTLSARRGGRVRFKLDEAATVTVRFTRRGSRKVVTRTVKVKAGTITVKVKARTLRRAKYTVSVRATDKAGNRSKTVKRTTRVGR